MPRIYLLFASRCCLTIALLAWTASVFAHPNHRPIGLAEEAAASSLSDSSAVEYANDEGNRLAYSTFTFLTDLAHRCPTGSQAECLSTAEGEFLIYKRAPDAPTRERQIARRRAVLKRLQRELPSVFVDCTTAGPKLTRASVVDLTRGLRRGLLVWVTNSTDQVVKVQTWQEGGQDQKGPSLDLAPGVSHPMLAIALVDDIGQSNASLCVTQTGFDSPSVLSVPVRVEEPATIRGTLVDSDSGEVWPGKLRVLGPDQQLRRLAEHAGNRTLSEKQLLQFWGEGKFYQLPFSYSSGRFEVQVPAGRTHLTLERGFEHEVIQREVDLRPGEVYDVELAAGRLWDMKSEGWVSGDTHVHWVINEWDIDLPLDLLSTVQRAEDVRVVNNLTLLHRTADKAFITPNQAPMGPVPSHSDGEYHIQMGEEYRNENLYGHLCFLNLKWLVPPIGTGEGIAGPDSLDYPINKTAILSCREQGGISIEAHGLGGSKDVPANVVQGLSDSLDQMPPQEYYQLLECGLRVPLTNGSDHPARTLGEARAYVHVDGEFSYEKWIDGIRKGRTFTTSGPLLTLTVNNTPIGGTLEARADETLIVKARVRSRVPVGLLEIVSNGQVLHSRAVDATTGEIELEIPAAESRWVVARCSPTGGFDALQDKGAAHTSPVYVEVDGACRFVPEAAELWVSRLRQHARDIRAKGRFANERQLREAVQYVQDGIDVFQQKIADAKSKLPEVKSVDAQPLLLQTRRLAEALEYIGNPLPEDVRQELERLADEPSDAEVTGRVQELLDPLCIAGVRLRPEKIDAFSVDKEWPIVQKGWRSYLVKVCNDAEITTRLRVESPNARALPHAKSEDVASRWMGLTMFDGRPMQASLSGLALEYRIVQIYSRDEGVRDASIEFSIDAKPGSRGRVIKEWRFDDGADGWEAANQVEVETRDGSLYIKGLGSDPFVTAETPGASGELLLRFWGEASDDGIMQVFHWTEERPEPDPNQSITIAPTPGVARQYEATINVDGVLAGVRIDPNVKASNLRIDWIDLSHAHRHGETWTSIPMRFHAAPAMPVKVLVRDKHPESAAAAFVIRDSLGRVYPEQSKRLAPDLFFHPQVYRLTGETVLLPPGEYSIEAWRGPESLREQSRLEVGESPATISHQVRRWIDPAERGWWSGDHHIHAAGCLHYQNPTQGIRPEDMIRQIMGEDLHVGCCLTWGPCFDYQKRFFSGKPYDLLRYPYLVRYDVEVSGFGSHASGHLNLLRLQEQIFPGGTSKDHWPTLGLNTLRWAKAQGAVCGTAHSAAGLTRYVDRIDLPAGPKGLPHYNIPAYDGIGANEFIMNVAHELPGPYGVPEPAIDFIATMNTPRVEELNMWYHTLNCGFRVRASGETDFPCMSGERVGIGRVYVKVDGELNYPDWVQGLQDGRSYVSDAKAHILDFRGLLANDVKVGVGENGSELEVDGPASVRFKAECAALLDQANYQSQDAEEVDVELIVNGYPVDSTSISANGDLTEVEFEAEISRSSWVAVRIFPHAHSNPIFVVVDKQPIRASKASAEWCLRGVDQCWRMKQPTYKPEEQEAAREAYDHARETFERLLAEAPE